MYVEKGKENLRIKETEIERLKVKFTKWIFPLLWLGEWRRIFLEIFNHSGTSISFQEKNLETRCNSSFPLFNPISFGFVSHLRLSQQLPSPNIWQISEEFKLLDPKDYTALNFITN